MKPAIQRVNVDFSVDMLKELDTLAKELYISRQAVIKTYLRQSLDQHYPFELNAMPMGGNDLNELHSVRDERERRILTFPFF